jgi:hypothetical protein
MDENNDNIELMPELLDIINRIKAYNCIHPQGCFIYYFAGFKPIDMEDEEYEDLDEDDKIIDELDDTKSIVGAFGDIQTLRDMSEGLRQLIEDNKDKDGFVNT